MAIKINGDNTVANPGFSGDDTDTGLQVGTNELKLVTGGTARATVDSAGKATFAGEVECASLDVDGAATIDGNLSVNRTSGTNDVFNGRLNGTATSTINADGSATFEGKVDVNNELHTHRASTTASNALLALHSDIGGTKTRKVTVRADGSAEFAGKLQVTNRVEGFAPANGDYAFNAYGWGATGNSHLFRGNTSGGTQVVSILDNGSATFGAGTERVGILAGSAGVWVGDNTSTDQNSANARINSNGSATFAANVGIGKTSTSVTTGGTLIVPSGTSQIIASGNNITPLVIGSSDDATLHLVGFHGASSQSGGSISITSSTSVSYNTSSDYRLKENVVDLDGAIDRVKQLAPKRFNFIVDADRTVDGFLAHEAQAVVPEAVTGTHNEVDDDGNAVMQGIDQAKLVPLLTAALKEAIAKIETLENQSTALAARISALESA